MWKAAVVALVALLVLSPGASAGGESEVGKVPPVTQIVLRSEAFKIYELKGEIEPGAEELFAKVVGDRVGGMLKLESIGGDLRAAMLIGRMVRERKMATAVYTDCLSACAIIWAAGKMRYKATKGTIGFHHPWRMKDGKVVPGDPEGLIVYFKILGYSDEAIRLFLAKPETFYYLTRDRAKELGIKMQLFH